MPLLFTWGCSPQRLLIPPFAESAKDGAPDPLWQGKKYVFDWELIQNRVFCAACLALSP